MIYADVRELTVGAVFQFEGQSHDGFTGVTGENDRRLVIVSVQCLVLYVGGAGEQSVDCIEKGLNPLVFISRSHENGGQLPLQCSPADGSEDEIFRNIPLFEDGFRQFV